MKNIIMVLDSIYQKKKLRNIYLHTLGYHYSVDYGNPNLYTSNRKLIGSFFIDFLVRSFITYSFCNLYYFVSHLEKYYEKFYSGADMSNNPAPDELKQVIKCYYCIICWSLWFFFPSKNHCLFLSGI